MTVRIVAEMSAEVTHTGTFADGYRIVRQLRLVPLTPEQAYDYMCLCLENGHKKGRQASIDLAEEIFEVLAAGHTFYRGF
jgi:hypothetical protein